MTESQQTEQSDATPTRTAELHVHRSGEPNVEKFTIGSRAVIGRFDPAIGPIDVDLASLPEATYVSRKHAEIEFSDGAWTITDLGSSNGTFVIGESGEFERITEGRTLVDGMEFALGNARFSFHEIHIGTSADDEGGAADESSDAEDSESDESD